MSHVTPMPLNNHDSQQLELMRKMSQSNQFES